jgi:hypothetical protein
MPDMKRIGDLELDQDLRHQKREWAAERVGWTLMALVLLASLLGLLGPGPLGRARAGKEGSPIWVEYNRFERNQSPVLLRIHLGPGAGREGRVRLKVNGRFIEKIKVEGIDPPPEVVEAGPEGPTYVFRVPDGRGPTALAFHYEPDKFGRLPVAISLEGGERVAFSQFIFP